METSGTIFQNYLSKIVRKHFNQEPKKVIRMTVGTANEVYAVSMQNNDVIVRLSEYDKFLYGSHKHIPVFKNLGIQVPDILAEDYSKTFIPYHYQILSKIEGRDLGLVIQTLNDAQLRNIAKEIANIINQIKTIPADGKFGFIYAHKEDLMDTWLEYMAKSISETINRGRQTGVLEDWMEELLNNILSNNRTYFEQVKSETYFDDMSSKNVMVHNGEFSGLVDLDCLAQGDYLEAISRIKASWVGTRYGEVYTNAVMDELNLNIGQRRMVITYAIFNRIYWACENVIQMNQNTQAIVNIEKDKENKNAIKYLVNEQDK